MAQHDTADTDGESSGNDGGAATVEIEVHYSTMDPESEAFELARDIRAAADPDLVDEHSFAAAYDRVGGGTIDTDEWPFDPTDTRTILGHVWDRFQGGRVDNVLGYDGSETRSMMIGDIIVVDGFAFFVGPVTSFPGLGKVEYLRGEYPGGSNDPDDGDSDDSDGLTTDGGSSTEETETEMHIPEDDCVLMTDGGTDVDEGDWPVSEAVDHSEYVPLDMANNIDDDRVKERIAWVDGFGRAYANAFETDAEKRLVTDGGQAVEESDTDVSTDDADAPTDKWDLDQYGRGTVLSLAGFEQELLVVDHVRAGPTTRALDAIAMNGTEYRLAKVVTSETFFDVTEGHSSTYIKNIDATAPARDFEVVGENTDRLEQYFEDMYPGMYAGNP